MFLNTARQSFLTGCCTLLAIGVVANGLALAAKPGGGGGGAAPPAGTIYYHWSLQTLEGTENRGDWTMNADGSGKQQFSDQNLLYSGGARLSYQMHGPTRWLLTYGSNPETGHYSLFATSLADGSRILLADGQSMTETNDFRGGAVWGKDDSFVSVVTRANSSAAYCQLYRAEVAFDADGVPGLASDWEWVTSGDVPGRTDISDYDWSRDGTMVALGIVPNNGTTLGYITLFDLITGTAFRLVSDSYSPRWSPTTDLIAFVPFNEGVCTVNPDGSGLRELTNGSGYQPHDWSPDGKYILFSRLGWKSVKGGSGVYMADTGYVPASGGTTVNLTKDIDGLALPRAWR